MRTSDLDYELPEELVAQRPLDVRHAGRMLVLDGARVSHARVVELPSRLPASLLVVNDTRVIPARLRGHKPTGGRAELLLVERLGGEGAVERWHALGRASKGLPRGTRVVVSGGALVATVEGRRPDGSLEVRLEAEDEVAQALERVGEVPLPPYIRRKVEPADRERYQTVFATSPGAVAAPTAGLHLSRELVDELEARGHELAAVTLHVGPGTFAPVKAESLDAHSMHEERYEVPTQTAAAIARARAAGRPVVAVGTTVVRALESAASGEGLVRAGPGATSLFVRPPHVFQVVDGLLTNFHLPRSTLLALVMAMGGVQEVRAAYRAAVAERYRFFSYGDAMLLMPRPVGAP